MVDEKNKPEADAEETASTGGLPPSQKPDILILKKERIAKASEGLRPTALKERSDILKEAYCLALASLIKKRGATTPTPTLQDATSKAMEEQLIWALEYFKTEWCKSAESEKDSTREAIKDKLIMGIRNRAESRLIDEFRRNAVRQKHAQKVQMLTENYFQGQQDNPITVIDIKQRIKKDAAETKRAKRKGDQNGYNQ